MISVIVPTIAERTAWLDRCKVAYAAHTTDYELIIVPDEPVCGSAWLKGAAVAKGDYIHFSADDLEPHAGWWQAAVAVCDMGFIPAPRILNTNGTIQSCGGWGGWETEAPTGQETDFPRIPFLTSACWLSIKPLVEPFLKDAHYYTDNAIGWAARLNGYRTGIHRDYLFTHHLAPERRGAGSTWEDRMAHDHAAIERHLALFDHPVL